MTTGTSSGPASPSHREAEPEITLWVVDLDGWTERGPDPDSLPAEDRQQAGRLRDPVAAARLLARRSATRAILGRTLDLAPSDLDLVRRCPVCGGSDHGRPSVRGSPLGFSVSSSAGVATVAVSLHDVGVDIELDQGVSPQWTSLSSTEQRLIRGLDPADRTSAFLRLWTGKEAVLKVAGRGLADDPSSIDVHGLVHTPAVIVDGVRGKGAGRWHVRLVSVGDWSPVPVVALADRRGGPATVRRFVE